MCKSIAKHRLNAFNNQSGLCYYCKSPMWINDKEGFAIKHKVSRAAAARSQCTAEHLTARCDGGGNSKSNIVAACLFCNNKRHGRKKPPTPLKYREHIKKHLQRGKWHPKELQHVMA